MPATATIDFEGLTKRHRRELHVHCYRMLASFDEADDAVQETYLRAWRHRERLDEDANVRAWMYKIATNVCLDLLRQRRRTSSRTASISDLPWLQGYPDALLDEVAASASDDGPESVVVGRETIELAFLAALQALPARQRAVLVARDVLGWPAADTAELLDTSVAAANSALQRARLTLAAHLPERRSDWTSPVIADEEREVLARFIDAHERLDAAAAIAVAGEDLRITMPPNPMRFDGLAQIGPLLERAFGSERDGEWRLLPTGLNRMPAAASYLLRPGDTLYRPFKLDVLRVLDGKIVEITTLGHLMFPALGLPPALPVTPGHE